MKRFRTILAGTCLLGGRHPEGSALAREGPVLNAGRRAERSRRAAITRWGTAELASGQAASIKPSPAPAGCLRGAP